MRLPSRSFNLVPSLCSTIWRQWSWCLFCLGVCIVSVYNSEEPIVFQNLGIARVKVKEIKESLTTREKLKIDPFNQGFDLKTTTKNVSLHQIRLCFQVRENKIRNDSTMFLISYILLCIKVDILIFLLRSIWEQEKVDLPF